MYGSVVFRDAGPSRVTLSALVTQVITLGICTIVALDASSCSLVVNMTRHHDMNEWIEWVNGRERETSTTHQFIQSCQIVVNVNKKSWFSVIFICKYISHFITIHLWSASARKQTRRKKKDFAKYVTTTQIKMKSLT